MHAKIVRWPTLVKDRLAVRAEERDAARLDAEFVAGEECGAGKNPAQTEMELAEFARGDGLLLGNAQDFPADRWRESDRGVIPEPGAETRRSAGDLGESDFDGVGGGAGHQAEDQ